MNIKVAAFTVSEKSINTIFSYCCLLILVITFATSFDPDQARQVVGPDLDHSDGIPERLFLKKLTLKKNQ